MHRPLQAQSSHKFRQRTKRTMRTTVAVPTCKRLGFVRGHCPQVAKIAFVAHQHDDNVAVCVVLQLFQPALGIFVRQVFRDVVHQESADGSTVVPVREMNDLINELINELIVRETSLILKKIIDK